MNPQGPPPGYGGYPPYGPPPVSPRNGMGIAALVLGILSIPTGIFVLGGIFAILAIIFAIIGIRRASRGAATNQGVAVGGLVTGIIGLLIAGLVLGIGIFAVSKASDCRDQLGARASDDAIAQCVQDNIGN